MPSTDTALIFINWNSADLLLDAVASLSELEEHIARYRIIVVDNGSADDSLAVLDEKLPPLLEKLGDRVIGLDVLPLGANMGFAAAVNAGLNAAKEPYAAVLNTDISFPHDAIGTLIQALRDDPDAVLACPRLLRPDDSEQPAAVPEPTLATELLNRSAARRLLLRSLETDKPQRVPSVVGPCMLVDTERLKPIGGLDERFFFFMEETDWCRRIREGGGQVLWVPDARVYHLQGASANKRPYRARIQFYESRYIYFAKHYGFMANAMLASGLFLRLIVNMLGSSLLAILTLGKAKHKDKLAVYAVLWWWHLRGCPRGESFDERKLD